MLLLYNLLAVLQRFLKAVGLLFVYMGLLALGLFLWLRYQPEPSEGSILLVFVILAATFPFAMDICGKWVFYWKSTNIDPRSLTEMKATIFLLDRPDIPIEVTERRGALSLTWKYLDAKWYEIIAKSGLTESYTLRVVFDEARHLATLTDIKRSISWRKDLRSFQFGFFAFRGVSLDVEVGKAWGITERFVPGKIYEYHFKTSEIRNPVLNALLEGGWDVRYGLF